MILKGIKFLCFGVVKFKYSNLVLSVNVYKIQFYLQKELGSTEMEVI
jgi:hypothetical protein